MQNKKEVLIIEENNEFITKLKNIIQTRIPQIWNTKTFETFEPVYYCNLFKHMFKKNFKKNPKTCICADLEQYPIIGNNQDITKKLSYCIQHNIPLMDKNKENEDLILSSLKEYIMRACKMNEEEIYR